MRRRPSRNLKMCISVCDNVNISTSWRSESKERARRYTNNNSKAHAGRREDLVHPLRRRHDPRAPVNVEGREAALRLEPHTRRAQQRGKQRFERSITLEQALDHTRAARRLERNISTGTSSRPYTCSSAI